MQRRDNLAPQLAEHMQAALGASEAWTASQQHHAACRAAAMAAQQALKDLQCTVLQHQAASHAAATAHRQTLQHSQSISSSCPDWPLVPLGNSISAATIFSKPHRPYRRVGPANSSSLNSRPLLHSLVGRLPCHPPAIHPRMLACWRLHAGAHSTQCAAGASELSI